MIISDHLWINNIYIEINNFNLKNNYMELKKCGGYGSSF